MRVILLAAMMAAAIYPWYPDLLFFHVHGERGCQRPSCDPAGRIPTIG